METETEYAVFEVRNHVALEMGLVVVDNIDLADGWYWEHPLDGTIHGPYPDETAARGSAFG
jgi:hypothetical protein